MSLLLPLLGEVTSVVAGPGRGDQVHLVMQHAQGRSSTASVTLTAPSAAVGSSMYVDGEHGRETVPMSSLETSEVVAAHQAPLDALIGQVAQPNRGHPCDVHFGARVVEVLDAAQRSLVTGRRIEVSGV